jgi:transglutaminase-like putative cysteine protease
VTRTHTLGTAILIGLLLIACQAQGTPGNSGLGAASTRLALTPALDPAATPTAESTPTPLPSATATSQSTPTIQPSPTLRSTPTASPTSTMLPTATVTPTPPPTPPSEVQQYEMTYEIEHPTVLGQQTLVDQLWIPVPNTDGGGTRDFELLEAYPAGYEMLEIGEANRAVYWGNVPELCQQTNCRFGIRFRITLERPMYTIPWSDPVHYDAESTLYQTYTQPQRGIESDDPTIRQLAMRIVGDETNPYKQVLRIQSWIQQNVRYPDLGATVPDDALLCIDQAVGDCAGQSKIFVALARAIGIPARTVSGLRPFEAGVGRLDQFGPRTAWFERTLDVHVWCEVYFPALGWVQCEPDMPGFGIDKERLITKRGPFEFQAGLCRQATYFHLPLAVQGNWCGQSVGWEVSLDAQPIE